MYSFYIESFNKKTNNSILYKYKLFKGRYKMVKTNYCDIKKVHVYKYNKVVADFCFDAIVRSYRYGFSHEVKIYYSLPTFNKAGHNEYKTTYYNSTYESYRFQYCITGCMNNIISEIKEEIKDRIKEVNGWKKLTENRRKAFEEAVEQDEVLKMLETVKKELSGNSDSLIEMHL